MTTSAAPVAPVHTKIKKNFSRTAADTDNNIEEVTDQSMSRDRNIKSIQYLEEQRKKDNYSRAIHGDLYNPKKLPTFIPPLHIVRVIKVYDGDTITVASTVPGLHESPMYKFSVRLNGIDTPEIRGKSSEEKDMAILARDALRDKIYGKDIRLENIKLEKYGRLLCDIYLGAESINGWMLNERYALEYNGKKKKS